jgi:hypothetical protein
MKRKLKWLAIVLAVSLLGFGMALFLWLRDRISAKSWRYIEIGMTENQVEEILGGPGMSWEQLKGRHFLGAVVRCEPSNFSLVPIDEDTYRFWTSFSAPLFRQG